jgi:hypothetical protein
MALGHQVQEMMNNTVNRCFGWMAVAALAVVLAVAAAPAGAQADAGADPAAAEYKLTVGRYHMNDGSATNDATDINLRRRQGSHTLWLGVIGDHDRGRQWRAGWDDQWALAADPALPLQLLPSLQLASGGFVGGSLAVQAGAPFYVQLGIGRTNLKPYANINFDPNDAIGLVLGWQGEGGRQLSTSVIADDRLGTGQQHHHLTLRWPLPDALRLSADLLHKQGQGDTGWVNTWGWTLGLDGAVWFARLARDPKQNFTAQDAWRLSGGRRF